MPPTLATRPEQRQGTGETRLRNFAPATLSMDRAAKTAAGLSARLGAAGARPPFEGAGKAGLAPE